MQSIRKASLLLVFFSVTLPACAQEHIRLGSFNIAEFGEGNHPATRDVDAIAQMIYDAKLDLIAVQEVGVGSAGETAMNRLVTKLNAIAPNDASYMCLISGPSGDEAHGFIYRDPIMLNTDEILWLDSDKEPNNPRAGGETFFRIPAAVGFSAGNFDFYVINMHLTWGNVERRKQEVKKLREFLLDDSDPEKDWICVGDMNRYGKFNKTASANAPFNALLQDGWNAVYRFPLLEAITGGTSTEAMMTFQAAEDAKSTTIAKSKNIYDQIIVTTGALHELDLGDNEYPKLGEHVAIEAFDMRPPFSQIEDHNTLKYKISDHRPIWIRFRIDLEDDD